MAIRTSLLAAAVAVAVAAGALAGEGPTAAAAAKRVPKTLVSPYVDMGLWPTADLVAMSAATGVRSFTAAFVVAETGTTCSPAWGSYSAYAVGGPGDFSSEFRRLQAQGGRVIVSFGGALGPELADVCTSDDDLLAAYQRVIDRYSIDRIDFDIEGASIANMAANARRARVVARLQRGNAARQPIAVSLTLPVMPYGLTANGLRTVREFADAGVKIAAVNVMAMDYGQDFVEMGAHAISAARRTAAQLKSIPQYRRMTPAKRMSMIGITPMIGQNDIVSEVFTIADARAVAAYARSSGVGLLAWWEMTRDQPCASPTSGLSRCTGVNEAPWAYSAAFLAALR